jgi:hypothetical protein
VIAYPPNARPVPVPHPVAVKLAGTPVNELPGVRILIAVVVGMVPVADVTSVAVAVDVPFVNVMLRPQLVVYPLPTPVTDTAVSPLVSFVAEVVSVAAVE